MFINLLWLRQLGSNSPFGCAGSSRLPAPAAIRSSGHSEYLLRIPVSSAYGLIWLKLPCPHVLHHERIIVRGVRGADIATAKRGGHTGVHADYEEDSIVPTGIVQPKGRSRYPAVKVDPDRAVRRPIILPIEPIGVKTIAEGLTAGQR